MAIRFRVIKVNPTTGVPIEPGLSLAFVDLPGAETFANARAHWSLESKQGVDVVVPAMRDNVAPQATIPRVRTPEQVRTRTYQHTDAERAERGAGVRKLQEMMKK
jgi:hypothetical protein